MAHVTANDVTIEFDTFGNERDAPVLLISGLGVQMIRWSDAFCAMLADRGFRVVRFDNRDVGLSTYFDDAPAPDFIAIAEAVARGEPLDVPYTLADMADDATGLLDQLHIEKAHIVGRSMGGMIGQLVAARHPGRTLSLTAIMSGTGNPDLPPASPAAMEALTSAGPDPSQDEEGYLDHWVATAKVISSPGFPYDETAMRAQARRELKRAFHPVGFGRQLAAIVATGDLRPYLKSVTAPTLVIHGTDDILIPIESGRDIAENIAGAELMEIEGMGHDLPDAIHRQVADAIIRNAQRGAAST